MTRPRAVLLLALVLFAWNLWGTDLWAPDEPYFAEGAREMLVDGRWSVPHVNGAVTTDKPPLFFWLIALVSLPFGAVSSWTARLPSLLATLGTVALVLRLGTRWSGAAVGTLAGLLAATNHLIWDKARSAQIDALLTFLVVAALAAFAAFRSGAVDGRRAGLLFWTLAALAVLAKGPVGVLLPLLVALVTLAWDRNLAAWRQFAPWAGPAAFVVILAAWITAATLGGDGEYSVWAAFRQHVLDRAVHGMHHRQPPWYYLEMLPVQLLPWTGLVPGGIWLAVRRRDAVDRLLLAWALTIVLFFSLSTEKRDLYVLPAYPAFLLLAARFVASLGDAASPAAWRWFRLPHACIAFLVAAAGALVPILNRRSATLPAAAAVALALPLALGGAASFWAAWRGRPRAAVAAMATGAVAVYLVLATVVLPVMNPVKSARALALSVRDRTAASRAAGHPVLAYRLGNLPESIAFYSNGVYLRETAEPQQVAEHLAADTAVFALLEAEHLGDLPEAARERLRIVDTATFARRKVLLISNRPLAERPS